MNINDKIGRLILQKMKIISEMWLLKSLNPEQKVWFNRYKVISEIQIKILFGENVDISKIIQDNKDILSEATEEARKSMQDVNDNSPSTGN